MTFARPPRCTATEFHNVNGIEFAQYMDLNSDRAYYHKVENGVVGEILMTVDSSGYVCDKDLKLIGRFRRIPGDSWAFLHQDGRDPIEHHSNRLYEIVEPFIIGKLFGVEA